MAEKVDVLTSNGAAPPGLPAPPVPTARASSGTTTATASAVRTFRVLTANVQSFPRTAITLAQAREDLRANARDGDLVLLQEIDQRYRRVVLDEFPATDWHVFYGPKDNRAAIAVRTEVFDVLDEEAVRIHPGVPGLHERRHLTHLRLRHRELGVELHAINLHLVAGAFHRPPKDNAALRQAEWHDAMRTHDVLIERLVATGAPVVAGGDYNRQLRAFRARLEALGGGRRVSFATDTASIDLLWFVDGLTATWAERARTTFRGREGRPPQRRNSDHHARQAMLALTASVQQVPTTTPGTVVIAPDGSSSAKGDTSKASKKAAAKKAAAKKAAAKKAAAKKASAKQQRRKEQAVASFAAQHAAPGATAGVDAVTPAVGRPFAGPPDKPFALTEFGDRNPKVVDWMTRAALEEVERRLDYRLTVVQGSYNNGRVKASGPTHDGGGVVDLLDWDWRRKVRVLREVGFAAWYRADRPGSWSAHIHAILIGHPRLDPSAAAQVVAYRAGLDGLRGRRVDDFPRPSPIPVFRYPPKPVDVPVPGAGEDRRKDSVRPLGSAFPPRRTLDGVDISHHQSGRLDLRAARAAGVRWVYVKATEGATFKDRLHRKRVRQARAAGLPVGAYHFARPEGRDAVTEARFFLANIDLRAGDMVPMLDLEDIGDLTLPQLTEWTGTWVRTVNQELRRRKLTGKPVIYTPFNLTKGFGCLLWVARYSDDFRAPVIPRPWVRAAIWQHSNGRLGPVKGVPGLGRVDVNALHPDLPLSALRLRPAGRPAKPARGKTPVVVTTAPVEEHAHAPTTAATTSTLAGVTATSAPQSSGLVSPTVTTTAMGGTADQQGTIVITVTVPLPATPSPVVLSPDLGPLEEQLTLAARGIQGAIEALPERQEP
jgi:GH25 family lysozyme M1 (1,4-beta-N-acetylmuramidase)